MANKCSYCCHRVCRCGGGRWEAPTPEAVREQKAWERFLCEHGRDREEREARRCRLEENRKVMFEGS